MILDHVLDHMDQVFVSLFSFCVVLDDIGWYVQELDDSLFGLCNAASIISALRSLVSLQVSC